MAGAFAVLIALVSNGFTTALIVLGIVLLVQQIEGNVLQPIIQGRGFNLHAGVVILAVTAGSSLAGIIGAFLSVPIAALIAVIYRYIRDELDGRSPEIAPDGTQARLEGDETGAEVVREQVTTPADAARDAAGQRPAALTPLRGSMGMRRRRARLHRASVRTDPGGPTVAQRPEELVELLPEAEPFLAREAAVGDPAERRGLVLVHDLAGDFDAAHAGALAGAHLLAALPHEVIARFDADSLVDYRAHRPRMTFSGDRYEDFAAPRDRAVRPRGRRRGAVPPAARHRARLRVGAVRRRRRPARGAARRHLGRRPAGDPDAGAAHPAGDRHRARHAPPADRALSRLLGRDADPRQRLGAARAAAGRSRASTPSAWPRTSRTTWPRPPIRRRRSRCSSTSSG